VATVQSCDRFLRAIQRLAHEPHPAGYRRLSAYDDVFRIRVGTYRVIYEVRRRQILVVILKVGHRKDVCR
jgi:mRNA interferase RelE/StbE